MLWTFVSFHGNSTLNTYLQHEILGGLVCGEVGTLVGTCIIHALQISTLRYGADGEIIDGTYEGVVQRVRYAD